MLAAGAGRTYEHKTNPNDELVVRRRRRSVLVAVTPNIDSLGHRWFGRAWLHLDPPRHLHLFSPRMLKEAAGHAHLRNTRVMTSAAHVDQAAMGSRNIARGENAFFGAPPTFVCMAASALIQAASWFYHALDRTKGDECVLIATAEREPIDPAASDENDHAVRAGHGAL